MRKIRYSLLTIIVFIINLQNVCADLNDSGRCCITLAGFPFVFCDISEISICTLYVWGWYGCSYIAGIEEKETTDKSSMAKPVCVAKVTYQGFPCCDAFPYQNV